MEKNTNSNYESNPFKVIFAGFSDFFNYNQAMAIVILVVSFLGIFVEFINFFLQTILSSISSTTQAAHDSGYTTTTTSTEATDPATVGIILLFVFIFFIIFWAISFVVATIYRGMVAYATVKTSQKKSITIGEAFKASLDKFWTMVWIQIVVGFKVLGGLLLLIVPGIRAALRYEFVMLPVFADGANAKQAIESSKKFTKNHLIETLGMTVAAGIIPFVGGLMRAGGQSVMYTQLTHLQKTNQSGPKVHWLNYLLFILIGGFILLIAFFAILIALLANAN